MQWPAPVALNISLASLIWLLLTWMGLGSFYPSSPVAPFLQPVGLDPSPDGGGRGGVRKHNFNIISKLDLSPVSSLDREMTLNCLPSTAVLLMSIIKWGSTVQDRFLIYSYFFYFPRGLVQRSDSLWKFNLFVQIKQIDQDIAYLGSQSTDVSKLDM